MADKVAVVTGVTGQDGSYLSQLLLDKDYEVHGVTRRSSTDTSIRLAEVKDDPNFHLVEGDLLDPSSVNQIISETQPDEIYNLAAQSHVGTSFKQPAYTFQTNAVGVLNVLEGVRVLKPDTKVYQASTSEMFGNNCSPVDEKWGLSYHQNEQTPLEPRSPYAVAKTAAHQLCFTYREAYDIFTSCGILFNHESERRGEHFVTRKITKYVAGLVINHWSEMGRKQPHFNLFGADEVAPLALGNLDACRDWGHAEDYVRAMWLMLQQEEPDDYVVATGKTHSIRDLLDNAFGCIGVQNWSHYVVQDPRFFRPADVKMLCGDATKAKEKLGWEPEIDFTNLVHRMVRHDIEEAMAKKQTASA